MNGSDDSGVGCTSEFSTAYVVISVHVPFTALELTWNTAGTLGTGASNV